MNNVKYICFFIISLGIFNSCKAQSSINQLDFMIGTWKIENKTTFEEWKKEKNNQLVGFSYNLKGGSKKVTENLLIKEMDNLLIYQATVLNQNDGKTILFTLNTSIKDRFSFENLSHDFPKKIQYQKINKSTLFVQVLGEKDKGFSYKIIKQ